MRQEPCLAFLTCGCDCNHGLTLGTSPGLAISYFLAGPRRGQASMALAAARQDVFAYGSPPYPGPLFRESGAGTARHRRRRSATWKASAPSSGNDTQPHQASASPARIARSRHIPDSRLGHNALGGTPWPRVRNSRVSDAPSSAMPSRIRSSTLPLAIQALKAAAHAGARTPRSGQRLPPGAPHARGGPGRGGLPGQHWAPGAARRRTATAEP